jgi:hypothetical protein
LSRDRFRRAPVVSCQHEYVEAETLQSDNRFRGVWFQNIGDGDNTGNLIVDDDKHRSLSLIGKPLRLVAIPLSLIPVPTTSDDCR